MAVCLFLPCLICLGNLGLNPSLVTGDPAALTVGATRLKFTGFVFAPLPSFHHLSRKLWAGLNMIDSYVWPSSLCLCPIFLLHKTSFSLCWSISLFVIGRLCKLNPLPIWGQRGATWERAREMFQMCTVFCAVFFTVCALCTARPVTRSKSQDPCLMARSLVICNRSRCFYKQCNVRTMQGTRETKMQQKFHSWS